jgi:hypothetical protein
MKIVNINYRTEDIFDLLCANYRQQEKFDPVFLKGHALSLETTIFEWREIGDLMNTDVLWKYLNEYFRLDKSKAEWMNILEPEDEKTLTDLCFFIACYAHKDVVNPIKLFGMECQKASLFRNLTYRLKERGINTSEIKPSSRMENLFKKHGAVITEEINLINPNVLPAIEYKNNWFYRAGPILIILSSLSLLLGLINSSFAWYALIALIVSIGLTWVGALFGPGKARFPEIDTVADLIRKMDS